MDFGCGTGLVGKYLHEDGFYNIVGLDASCGMLQEADQKGVYSQLEHMRLCSDDFMDTIPYSLRNRFDYLTMAGLLNNNYLDERIFS